MVTTVNVLGEVMEFRRTEFTKYSHKTELQAYKIH